MMLSGTEGRNNNCTEKTAEVKSLEGISFEATLANKSAVEFWLLGTELIEH